MMKFIALTLWKLSPSKSDVYMGKHILFTDTVEIINITFCFTAMSGQKSHTNPKVNQNTEYDE